MTQLDDDDLTTCDLAALLAAALITNRDEINASRIAHGSSGRIELHVNLALRRIDVQIMVRDPKALHCASSTPVPGPDGGR